MNPSVSSPPASMSDITLQDYQFELYLPEVQIQQRIKELAAALNRDYEGKRPLLIVVLNGAFLFAADLVRYLTVSPEIQFIRITTYGDTMSSSETAQILLGMEIEVEDRDIIVVEDIVDTGYTAEFFRDHLEQQGPRSVKLATLLFKPDKFSREHKHKPEYIGFHIPPAFVVGYGMDYAQLGRELRDIYRLKEDKD